MHISGPIICMAWAHIPDFDNIACYALPGRVVSKPAALPARKGNMTSITFDKLAYSENMQKAGFTREQADAMAKANSEVLKP